MWSAHQPPTAEITPSVRSGLRRAEDLVENAVEIWIFFWHEILCIDGSIGIDGTENEPWLVLLFPQL